MAMEWGSFALGSGILYSVMLPVLGSSLPISPRKLPVNHILPSLSSANAWGAVNRVLTGFSLISFVLGSTCPSFPASWPVYQMLPSRAAIGSWGREPGVGTGHSLIVAGTGPSITTAAGRA